MKTKLIYAALVGFILFFSDCKKSDQIAPNADLKGNDLALDPLNAAGIPANTVITIAGNPNERALVNGPFKTARFNEPMGIQFMRSSGDIYVADQLNNVIRKLSKTGIVSTFEIPKPGDIPLMQPSYIGIQQNGFVNIICEGEEGFSEARIYTPDGKLTAAISPFYAIFKGLAKDPYQDAFWSSFNSSIIKFQKSTPTGEIGTDALQFTNDFLSPDEPQQNHWSFETLFVGYNKVTYFATPAHIYAHLQSGYTKEIFTNLTFTSITSIIANKDSHTIYVADNGYIKRIDDGRMSIVAGPNPTYHDNRDGVGSKADVHAFSLALGESEHVLYFSDLVASSIRKVILLAN
jgi:hypothetical protein